MSSFFAKPSQLDIVYGKFPYHEEPATPGPIPHPCLVLDVFEEAAQSGRFWVVIAFGTSKKVGELLTGQFAVSPQHGAPFKKSGLALPTKFSFEREKLAKLPYSDEWFAIPKPPRTSPATPKIGVLDAGYFSRAIQTAGAAANIQTTLKELEAIEFGALPAE